MTIALIDYGAGNLTSVRKGFAAVGAELAVPAAPADLDDADGIVVPGVGHFDATRSITEAWRRAITSRVDAGVPLLGICLGMQWLFDGSEEAPGVSGLGILAGRCMRMSAPRPLKVPHVGWNALHVTRAGGLLDGVPHGTQVYFTHSYAAPVTDACTASSEHGAPFAAVVQQRHVMGVQFHPEKSAEAGLLMLKNFVRMTER